MRELPPGATFWNCSAVHGGCRSLYGFPRVRCVTPNISQVLWYTFQSIYVGCQQYLRIYKCRLLYALAVSYSKWQPRSGIIKHNYQKQHRMLLMHASYGSMEVLYLTSDVRVYFQLDLFRLDLITDRCNPPSARQESCYVILE